jgi:hypothetical protein
MWKNMAQPVRPHDNIIEFMHFTCWMTKVTDFLRIFDKVRPITGLEGARRG